MSNEKCSAEELCGAVFVLSRCAEQMEIDKIITVPDEQGLFRLILNWARKFEMSFDPATGTDYQFTLETRGREWLLETFPYDPEQDEQRKAVIDYIQFKADIGWDWPWAASAGEMIQSDLRSVERCVYFGQGDDYDSNELCAALDRVFGVNPALIRHRHIGSMEEHDI